MANILSMDTSNSEANLSDLDVANHITAAAELRLNIMATSFLLPFSTSAAERAQFNNIPQIWKSWPASTEIWRVCNLSVKPHEPKLTVSREDGVCDVEGGHRCAYV